MYVDVIMDINSEHISIKSPENINVARLDRNIPKSIHLL